MAIKTPPPPGLKAILEMVGKASGHALLLSIQFRKTEADFHVGADWEKLNPKPLPGKIHTETKVGLITPAATSLNTTSVNTFSLITFWQALTGDVPAEVMVVKDQPTVFGLVIRATLEVQYFVDEELIKDEQARVVFAKTNGIMVAWPYWREWVASSSARLGVQGQTMPFMTLPQAIHMSGLFDVEAAAAAELAARAENKPAE